MSSKPILDPKRELPAPHDMLLEEGDGKVPPPPSEKEKKFPFPLWILPLIGFLILLLAGGMYLLNQQKQETKPVSTSQPTITPKQVPVPTLTLLNTTDWKTYIDKKYGFSLKYPPSWRQVSEETYSSEMLESKKVILTHSPACEGCGGYLSGVHIYIYPSNGLNASQSASEWLKKAGPITKPFVVTNLPFSLPHDFAVVNGFPGAGSPGPEVLLVKDKRLIDIASDSTEENIVYTIFSTINLTAADVSPSPSISQAMKICTMDAKLCPDGSSVGRTGPNCEFAACPK